MKFTNTTADPDKSIVVNASGPNTVTVRPNGTRTYDGQGLNFFIFGPISRTNIQQPQLLFTSAHVVVDYLTTGARPAVRFSLSGTKQDGCALLS